MKLIVGLGNPEKKYDKTRHNAGFEALDFYAEQKKIDWQDKTKFKAMVAEISGDEKVLLVKPATYYNLVGESVRTIADFYKVEPRDILVIHDDHMIPFGTIRTREQGSDAGNNGIKSINAHLGPNTCRIRIGTGAELREKMADSDYVLGKFSATERKELPKLQNKIAEIIDDFVAGKFFITTHR